MLNNLNFLKFKKIKKNQQWPVLVTVLLIIVLSLMPNNYEASSPAKSYTVKAKVQEIDNRSLHTSGLIRTGTQECIVEILKGKYKGEDYSSTNLLIGKLEIDKLFEVGDKALVVIDEVNNKVTGVTMVDHYRIEDEIFLAITFILLLILFAGMIGVRALLSFFITILAIWKLLLPAFLAGYNPIIVALFIVVLLTTLIILLVYGFDKRAMAAISGSILGTLLTCILAVIFVARFRIHGAVMPYSESLLYAGYVNINLTEIYTASIFIASSGAVMDLAVDITSALHELTENRPDLGFKAVMQSGFNVGKAVIGTMTTTLLLAYSGGFIGLMMVFMAQGTPMINILNLKFVASEILHTLVGSIGLVTVAPFTAVTAAYFLTKKGTSSVYKNSVSR